MLKNKILWITIPLFFYTLYDNRKKIYYSYKWFQLWSIVKGVGLLKQYGLMKKNILILTKDEIFINKYKINFLYKINLNKNIEKEEIEKLNKNMLNIYYNKTELTDIISNNRENNYELIWKKRNIIINTPYGNIGMNYNLYHKGFSYYSDIKNIPYNILTCISMNYVLMYYCLDFYVDNTIINDWISPFWIIWDKETKSNETTLNNPFIKRLDDVKLLSTNKQIIAKLKNYRLDFGKDEKGQPNIIYNKNRFIYSGKITDMPSFKVKKIPIILNTNKISFQEYKKLILLKDNNKDINHNYEKLFI